ncbi:MAG: hypothetical protein GY771_04780, partial [bacterium]|nr:hypothetical protein [bacterium]
SGALEDDTFETDDSDTGDESETVVDFEDTGTMESDYGGASEFDDSVDWMDDLPDDTGEEDSE